MSPLKVSSKINEIKENSFDIGGSSLNCTSFEVISEVYKKEKGNIWSVLLKKELKRFNSHKISGRSPRTAATSLPRKREIAEPQKELTSSICTSRDDQQIKSNIQTPTAINNETQ